MKNDLIQATFATAEEIKEKIFTIGNLLYLIFIVVAPLYAMVALYMM